MGKVQKVKNLIGKLRTRAARRRLATSKPPTDAELGDSVRILHNERHLTPALPREVTYHRGVADTQGFASTNRGRKTSAAQGKNIEAYEKKRVERGIGLSSESKMERTKNTVKLIGENIDHSLGSTTIAKSGKRKYPFVTRHAGSARARAYLKGKGLIPDTPAEVAAKANKAKAVSKGRITKKRAKTLGRVNSKILDLGGTPINTLTSYDRRPKNKRMYTDFALKKAVGRLRKLKGNKPIGRGTALDAPNSSLPTYRFEHSDVPGDASGALRATRRAGRRRVAAERPPADFEAMDRDLRAEVERLRVEHAAIQRNLVARRARRGIRPDGRGLINDIVGPPDTRGMNAAQRRELRIALRGRANASRVNRRTPRTPDSLVDDVLRDLDD